MLLVLFRSSVLKPCSSASILMFYWFVAVVCSRCFSAHFRYGGCKDWLSDSPGTGDCPILTKCHGQWLHSRWRSFFCLPCLLQIVFSTTMMLSCCQNPADFPFLSALIVSMSSLRIWKCCSDVDYENYWCISKCLITVHLWTILSPWVTGKNVLHSARHFPSLYGPVVGWRCVSVLR